MRSRRRSYNGFDYNSRFPPKSAPREAKGGIKSQSQRGKFGESWWAKRWIGVLESFNIGARLGRGRSYARHGQVLSVQIEQGMVKAQVQGSRREPYRVAIQVTTLSLGEWQKVAEALSNQAIFMAKLLAGEMPDNIEEAFTGTGVSLFPEKVKDLQTDCSCPDWSNPCKHIAAVYYLLGEEFDRDPFLIFRLRGMDREGLMGLLGGLDDQPLKEVTSSQLAGHPLSAREPLPIDPGSFWGGKTGKGVYYGDVSIPPISAALPKRLGRVPLWSGEEDFISAMEGIYQSASQRGLEVFLEEPVFLQDELPGRD